MKKLMTVVGLAVLAGVGYSAEVRDVTVSADAKTHLVTIGYTLSDGPAIVTFDVTANGAPVAAGNLRATSGAINRKLAGGTYSFVWRPGEAWALVQDRSSLKVQVKAWALDNPPPYMTIEYFGNKAVKFYASAELLPYPVTDPVYKTGTFLFRKIPAAGIPWTMGADGGTGNQTPHTVTFTKDYYIGVYPVTLAQYVQVKNLGRNDVIAAMGQTDLARSYGYATDSYGMMRPAVGLSYTWYLRGTQRDDSAYNWPNHRDVLATGIFGLMRSALPGFVFDLPTNAQWEYACRAGVGTKFGNGSDTDCSDVAWYAGNNEEDPDWVAGMPHAVGLKKPNNFGLYDMHGNVDEWVLDYHSSTALADETDPEGPIVIAASGAHRVIRGGNFTSTDLADLTSAVQKPDGNSGGQQSMNIGFRICCPAVVQ